MLFSVSYRRRANPTDDETQELLRRFLAWTPPEGIEVLAHYHYVRGGGGIAIIEASGSHSLFEALTAFQSQIDYDVEPVLSIIDAVAIRMDVDEWVKALGPAARRG